MTKLTTGTGVVDNLIDEVHVGDNLVIQGGPTVPVDLLVRRFIDAMHGVLPLVVVNLGSSRGRPLPAGVTVLEWPTLQHGSAASEPAAPLHDATLEDALSALRDADERVGPGAAFVIDGLAQAQQTWGADAALELFLWTCPRLYRRRSLALWPIEVAAHKPTFLRRLSEITQVVVELSPEPVTSRTRGSGRDSPVPGSRSSDGVSEPGPGAGSSDRATWPGSASGSSDGGTTPGAAVRLTVRKADGRHAGVVGRTIVAVAVTGDLQPVGAQSTTRRNLGDLVHDQRLARGLVQADVARQVGISPSALSQIERGVRGPSGDTLARLWEVLGVPFGPDADADAAAYRISRRSGRDRRTLQPGLVGELIIDDTAVGALWLVEAAAGAAGDRAPFAVKSPEVITVLRGVLDLVLEGRRETLSEGDALVATTTAITGWANPTTAPTEVSWSIHPAPGRMPHPG